MIIVPELQMVVLTPPRCASTATHAALVARWPKAMSLFRHRERNGIPGSYQQWTTISLIRHPVERLYSLYKYMKNIPRAADTEAGKYWLSSCEFDTRRPFYEWLVGSYHPFHIEWPNAPRYDMVTYRPITRRGLHTYLQPWLPGDLVTLKMETELDRFEKILDINLELHNNTDTTPAPINVDVRSFIAQHHRWDLEQYS